MGECHYPQVFTALAFALFSKENVDIAVIEVQSHFTDTLAPIYFSNTGLFFYPLYEVLKHFTCEI